MKIVKKSLIFYFLIITFLYVLYTGFFLYYEKQTTYDRLSNQLYFDNILLVYNGHSINWADIEIPEQYRVYIEIDPNCRGLIKDTSKWTPPMLSGNYPQEASNAVAVIGKNVEKATYRDAEGNQWISYIGEEFRVTGIVGAEYATSCDDLIILFDEQFRENDLGNTVDIVDAKTQTGAQKIAKRLISDYPEIQIQHGTIKGTARLTQSSYFYRLLIIELLFITVFSVFLFGRFRHKEYDALYKVYQISGFPLTDILIKREIEILVINLMSLFTVCGVSFFCGLLTSGQIKNIVWISIGLITFSGILEAVLFTGKVAEINTHNRRINKLTQNI